MKNEEEKRSKMSEKQRKNKGNKKRKHVICVNANQSIAVKL